MPKQNPLSRGLKQQRHTEPVAQPEKDRSFRTVPSRAGRVLIGGHFAPEVQTALKVLAAEERTSVQALLAEGINAVFARRHKPQIADLKAAEENRQL
jgi:hypothetical protein